QHANYVGPFSMSSAWTKRGIDLVVAIGARDFGGRSVPGSPEAPDAKILRIGIDTAAMGRNYPTDLALVGDVRETLRDLSEAIGAKARNKERGDEIRAFTTAQRDAAKAARAKTFGRSPIHPEQIGAEMARVLDKDTIVVSENITGAYDSFPFGFRE